MNSYLKKLFLFSFLFFLLIPSLTKAITIEPPFALPTFKELIDAIVDFITWVAIAIVPIMIIVAAFYFLTSAGDPEQVRKAKKIILFTCIGLVVIFLSRGIVTLIGGIFEGGSPPPPPPPPPPCVAGTCDTVNRQYCNGGVWTPIDDPLYCANCNNCTDGFMNCGETGVDCGGGGCASCVGDVAPPTILNAQVNPDSGPPGTLFTITADIADSLGVDSTTTIAHIQNPDETDIALVTLYDDGSHSDGAANDGTYGGSWDSTGFPVAAYYIDITACDLIGNCGEEENI